MIAATFTVSLTDFFATNSTPSNDLQLLRLHKATQQEASDKDILTFLLENQLVQWYVLDETNHQFVSQSS